MHELLALVVALDITRWCWISRSALPTHLAANLCLLFAVTVVVMQLLELVTGSVPRPAFATELQGAVYNIRHSLEPGALIVLDLFLWSHLPTRLRDASIKAEHERRQANEGTDG